MNELAADSNGEGLRVCIVVAQWNASVTYKLLDGAKAGLGERGVRADDITVAWVPGSFEVPPATRWAAESGNYDAVIAIGTVIRGETDHYEHIAGQAAAGIMETSQETGVPVAFGVLTCDTAEQALARAGGKHGNKGEEAAEAAIQMARLRERLA
ncbi:MAG: 6,7-dimethyl-8-ribityllumazine synthase [Chloroflexota bacterium]|nr:6,7-dimethyl-8-ribityllumazine synthase [Chloroflexota bacterium]MDE2668076.1 6,7-dimethyl-8-ribityllumazine synthase [Chloroflexota bacterium]